jgi:hypothetical protein
VYIIFVIQSVCLSVSLSPYQLSLSPYQLSLSPYQLLNQLVDVSEIQLEVISLKVTITPSFLIL